MTIKEKLVQAIFDFPTVEDDPRKLFREAADKIEQLESKLAQLRDTVSSDHETKGQFINRVRSILNT